MIVLFESIIKLKQTVAVLNQTIIISNKTNYNHFKQITIIISNKTNYNHFSFDTGCQHFETHIPLQGVKQDKHFIHLTPISMNVHSTSTNHQ